MGYEIYGANAIEETDDALLVEAHDFDEPELIPKSQLDEDSEVNIFGDSGILIVSEWLAKKRGWL